MNQFQEKLSSIVSAALDLLLFKHPTRTSIGIVFGLSLSFFAELFNPVLKNLDYIDISKVTAWGWLPVGIFTVHAPIFVWNIFNKPVVNEEINELTLLIEKGNFSPAEKRQQYRMLINKTLQHVVFNSETQQNMKKIKDKIEQVSQSDIPDKK